MLCEIIYICSMIFLTKNKFGRSFCCRGFATAVLLVFCSVMKAQKTDSGKVELVQDEKIPEMVQKYTESQDHKIKGYRVQVYFGAEKLKAKDAKSKFLSKNPDTKAYEIFETPYFKIRAGNFRTKLEAYQFLQKIKGDFPGAFIVEDEIELPEL